MKKKILFVMAIAGVLMALSSCEPDDCKTCKAVTYDATTGAKISETAGVQYCGDELTAIENEAPQIVGNEKTQWECD